VARQDLAEIRRDMLPLREPGDLGPLLDRIGAARLVLIGEASHGTSEFYRGEGLLLRRVEVWANTCRPPERIGRSMET
jgi:erythromycin esterase-like protein